MNLISRTVRSLRRNPTFSVAVVLTLALGIGVNAGVFSVVHSVLLRSLPFEHAERTYTLLEQDQQGTRRLLSYPTFEDYSREARSIDAAAFVLGESVTIRMAEGPVRVLTGMVSSGFFETVGVAAALGRTFTPDEERGSGGRVAVLTHGAWQRRFGGDPAIVGRELSSPDGSYTVIGVLPRGFKYPTWAAMYVPLAGAGRQAVLAERGSHVDSRAIARLRPGSTRDAAAAELRTISARLAGQYPDHQTGWTAAIDPVDEELVGGVARQLWLVLGAVACVLLVACVNVANLSLVRVADRSRELSVRAALGAGRSDLVADVVVEVGVLAIVGAALGVVLASVLVDALPALATIGRSGGEALSFLPRLDEIRLDWPVLAFTVALTVIVTVGVAAAPALVAARRDPAIALGRDSRNSTGRVGRLRDALVVAQVAVAVMLLAGAGLLVRSYREADAVDPGFRTDDVLSLRMFPPASRYDSPGGDITALYARVLEEITAVPGVEAAGIVNQLVLTGTWMGTPLEVNGRVDPELDPMSVGLRTVSSGYFDVLDVRLLRGRLLDERDARFAGEPVPIVITESLADRFWPGENPIGRAARFTRMAPRRADFGTAIDAEVVGVIADMRHFSLDQPPELQIFVPYSANPWPWIYLAVKTRGPANAAEPMVRSTLLAVDRDLVIDEVATLDALRDASVAPRRFAMRILAGFAAAAIGLAALGLYGVLAYLVARRTREIGVRIALGAEPAAVLRLVIGHGTRLALGGMILGVALALAGGRLVSGLLFGVTPHDPLTLGAVVAVLAAATLIASYIPARRATRVSPLVALSAE